MALSANAFEAFITTIAVKSGQMSAELSRQALIAAAMAERDRVINAALSRSGIPPAYRQVVDGILDAPLEAVKPWGVIVFSWQLLREIVLEVVHALVDRAPRRSGNYLDEIKVFVDGVQAAVGAGDESNLREIDITTGTVTIVATADYARRLEVGKDKHGQPFVKQVKWHIVEETAVVTRRLYGQVADIAFTYVDLTDAHRLISFGRQHRDWRNGRWYVRPKPRRDTHVRYPAILIKPRVA